MGYDEEFAAMSVKQRARIFDLLVKIRREMKVTNNILTRLVDSMATTAKEVVVAVPDEPHLLGANLDTQLHLDTDEQLCSDAVSDTYLDQDTVAARLVTNDEDLEYLVLDMHLLNTAPPPHQQQEAVAGQALKDGVEEEVMAAIWYTNMLLPFGKENDHKLRYSSSVSPTTCSMEVPHSILCFTTPMPVHNVTKEPDLACSHDVTAATFGMTSTCSMKCFSLAAPTGWVFLVAEGFTFDPDTVMDVCCNSGLEPWPPPLSVYIIGSDIAIRPAPWPNFIMHIVLVGGFKGSVLLSSIGDFSLFICNEKHIGVLVEISDCFLWKLPCCYVHGENNRSMNFVEFIADQQQSTGMSWFITDIISGAVHPVLQIEVFEVFFDRETLLIGQHAIALLVVMARVNAFAVALLGYFLDNAVFSYLTIVSVTISKRYMLSYRRILSAFMVVCLEIMGSLSFGPHFELDASRRPIPMTISDNSLWSNDANSSYYSFQEFSTRMHAFLVSSCSIFFEAHIILEYITEQRKQLEHGDKLVALGITGCKDVPKLLANRIVQKVSTSMKHSCVRHRQKDNRRGARLWVLANAGLATSELRTVLSSVIDWAMYRLPFMLRCFLVDVVYKDTWSCKNQPSKSWWLTVACTLKILCVTGFMREFDASTDITNGTTITDISTREDEDIFSKIQRHLKNENVTGEVKATSYSNVLITFTVHPGISGLKAILCIPSLNQKSAEAKLQCLHDHSGITTVVGMTASPAINLSGAFGTKVVPHHFETKKLKETQDTSGPLSNLTLHYQDCYSLSQVIVYYQQCQAPGALDTQRQHMQSEMHDLQARLPGQDVLVQFVILDTSFAFSSDCLHRFCFFQLDTMNARCARMEQLWSACMAQKLEKCQSFILWNIGLGASRILRWGECHGLGHGWAALGPEQREDIDML